jgi:hypothetical protein
MRGYIPPRPTGFTREARFDQAVWDKLWGREAKLNNSARVKVRRTSGGKFFELKDRGPGAASGKECFYG